MNTKNEGPSQKNPNQEEPKIDFGAFDEIMKTSKMTYPSVEEDDDVKLSVDQICSFLLREDLNQREVRNKIKVLPFWILTLRTAAQNSTGEKRLKYALVLESLEVFVGTTTYNELLAGAMTNSQSIRNWIKQGKREEKEEKSIILRIRKLFDKSKK